MEGGVQRINLNAMSCHTSNIPRLTIRNSLIETFITLNAFVCVCVRVAFTIQSRKKQVIQFNSFRFACDSGTGKVCNDFSWSSISLCCRVPYLSKTFEIPFADT